jgi:diguanylate cyclase (GGDEF)-like protein
MRLKPRIVVNLAFIGFVLTLLALVAYVVWSMRSSRDSFDSVVRSTNLSNAYRNSLTAATEAELAATRFLVSPNLDDRRAFDAAIADLVSSVGVIRAQGDEPDRATIDGLYSKYAPQIVSARASFDAVLRGEASPDLVPSASVGREVTSLLMAPADARHDDAVQGLRSYRGEQRTTLLLGLVAYAIAVPLMFVLLSVVRHYERREIIAEMEMRRLAHAALTDSLTDLGNHRAFQEDLAREVRKARNLQESLCLALIDIDEFKEVNDRAGHAHGDQILLELGGLLRGAVDTDDRLFRIGGDEFAVVMPSCGIEASQFRMERARTLASSALGATISVGLAMLEEADDDELLRAKADAALYLAKRRGRNAVSRFSSETGATGLVTQAKIDALRDLIRDENINVAFQPIWNAARTSFLGCEALARLPDEYGVAGPQEAFDIAERLGRSYDLDVRCLRAIMARAGKVPEGRLLFVNLAPRTLEHADFSVTRLLNQVVAAGISPTQICIEITERSTASIAVVQRETVRLREAGFRIALDDVGAGNSGLEMLRRLTFDFVKIDHSVLLGALDGSGGRGVLMAIVAFASEAGALVIAEGVENAEMLGVVQEVGGRGGIFRIQGLQGDYLSKPDPVIAWTPELTERIA